MLQNLFGAQLDLPVRLAIALLVIGVLLGLTVFIVRHLGREGRGGAARSRQARLAVLDSVTIDPRRRLVLVRRDEVEHLLLVGGSTDIVVEPAISRAPAREPAVLREPAVAREPAREAMPPREPREALPLREPREALAPREGRDALPAREAMLQREALPPREVLTTREAPLSRETVPPREATVPREVPVPREALVARESIYARDPQAPRRPLSPPVAAKPALESTAGETAATPPAPAPAKPEEPPTLAAGVAREPAAAPAIAAALEADAPAPEIRRPLPARRTTDRTAPAIDTPRRPDAGTPRAPFVRPQRLDPNIDPARVAPSVTASVEAPAASEAAATPSTPVQEDALATKSQAALPTGGAPRVSVAPDAPRKVENAVAPEVTLDLPPPASPVTPPVTPPVAERAAPVAPPELPSAPVAAAARADAPAPRRGTTFTLGKDVRPAGAPRTEPRLAESAQGRPTEPPVAASPVTPPPVIAPVASDFETPAARAPDIIPALTLEDLLGPDAAEIPGDAAGSAPPPVEEAAPARRGLGALFRTANMKARPEGESPEAPQQAPAAVPGAEPAALEVMARPAAARVVEPTDLATIAPDDTAPDTARRPLQPAPEVRARPVDPRDLKVRMAPPAPAIVVEPVAPNAPEPAAATPAAATPAPPAPPRRWVLPRATPPKAPQPDAFARELDNPFALDSGSMVSIDAPTLPPPVAESKAPAPPKTEAATEKDPFEDLEAEMANLLGRGTGPR